MTACYVLLFFIFWVAPILTVLWLSDRDGKDPTGPILGAVFFSWAGGLIIWALIKPDPKIIKDAEDLELVKDMDYLYRKRKKQEISPEKKAELEKLLRVPKSKM